MKVSFVVALLVASIAGATAQGTLAPTPPPAQPPVMNGTFNVDNIPVGPVPAGTGLPFLAWTGFEVVSATGVYAGTEAETDGLPHKVITNTGGGTASISSTTGQTFNIGSFYYANPSATASLAVLVTCMPTGARKTLLLTPDQGATLFALDFVGCTSVTFTPISAGAGRKLQQASGQFTLDNIGLTAGPAVVAAPPPGVTSAPTAVPTGVGAPPPGVTAAPTAVPTGVGAPPPGVTPAPTAVPTGAGAPPPGVTAAPTAVPTGVGAPPPGVTAAPTAVPTGVGAPPPGVTPAPTAVPTGAGAPPPGVTAAPTAVPTRVSPPPFVQASPPPFVQVSPPPFVLPTAVPTKAPPPGVTSAPTAAPTQMPTAAPTAVPTKTPTARPTPKPTSFPASCTASSQYRSQFGCARCVSRSSPFKQFSTVGSVCYPPTTLSSRSTVCTSAVLPAFIQSNINKKRTVRCINPKKPLVTLLLPLKNSNLPFLNAGSYVGASLRLNGVIARNGFSNGERVFSGFNQRLRFTFTDSHRTLLKKFGQTVQLTGTLRRGGNLLSYCFVSYLKVC